MVLVGSANFTEGGFKKNEEASVLTTIEPESDFSQKMDAYFSRLKNSPTVRDLKDFDIDEYQRKRKRIKVIIEKQAPDFFEEGPTFGIDYQRLKKIRTALFTTTSFEDELSKRQSKYSKAKEILDIIVDADHLSESSFKEFYEQLVGKKHESEAKFWTSDKLFRRKKDVIKKPEVFQELIAFIRDNANQDLEVLFDGVQEIKKRIKGVGPNIFTEIMMTFSQDRFPILNGNQIGALRFLGCKFPDPSAFKSSDYEKYCALYSEIRKELGLPSMMAVDTLLNQVYWNREHLLKLDFK
jgi:hypothetical protein